MMLYMAYDNFVISCGHIMNTFLMHPLCVCVCVCVCVRERERERGMNSFFLSFLKRYDHNGDGRDFSQERKRKELTLSQGSRHFSFPICDLTSPPCDLSNHWHCC